MKKITSNMQDLEQVIIQELCTMQKAVQKSVLLEF